VSRPGALRILAALLLLPQTGGGGLVALAHAREAPTAPRTIEAVHDARCAVVHDALHCALCQLASHRLPPGRLVMPWTMGVAHVALPPIRTVGISPAALDSPFRPRAPPRPRA